MEQTQPRQDHSANVERDYPHNRAVFVLWEFVWGLGLPFALSSTVVPAYMMTLNSPKILIGIATSLLMTLCPLQLVTSHFLAGRPRKRWLVYSYILGIAPWLLYGIVVFACGPEHFSDTVLLAMFFVAIVIFSGTITANDAVALSIITDCTPLKKRGSLWGYRFSGLAIAMLLGAPVAHWVMRAWPEVENYCLAFIIANALRILACTLLAGVREHKHPDARRHHRDNPRVSRFVPKVRLMLRALKRNPNYRVFIFFAVLMLVATASGSFAIVFAKEHLDLGGAQIMIFSVIQMVVSAVIALSLGRLADRAGYRMIGIIQGILGGLGLLIFAVIAAGDLSGAVFVYLGFCLYSSMIHVNLVVMVNLSVELMPKHDSGTLAAFGNLIAMPLILLISPLCGLVIDLTGSYVTVFLAGTMLAVVSSAGYAVLVREPRKQKMYIIRNIRKV